MTDPRSQDKLSRKELTASEERFRALVIATSDVIYSLSPDWQIMQELDGRGFLRDADKPTSSWKEVNVYHEDLEMVNKAIEKAIREKSIFQLEHRVNRADGTTGWTFSRAVPILNDQGEIIEWFGAASDITDRKRAEETLQETTDSSDRQKRLLEAITSGTPDLMYVFDLNYRFTYVNEALLTMWGKTWDDAVGKGLRENGYEEWHAAMHEREIDHVRETRQSVRGEVSFPHAVLGSRVYDYILIPVINDQGEVEAVAGTTRDVTERKQWELLLANKSELLQVANEEIAASNEEHEAANEELTAANEELALVNQRLLEANNKIEDSQIALKLAIEAADFGTWYIHSETREFITSPRLKELFGYYPDEDLSVEQALAQVTDEYRELVAAKLENAIANKGDYDLTYPVIGLHDQKLRWLRAIGNLKADPSGAFSAFTGVVMDITEQHLAARKIERAESNLRMALEAADSGTYSLNASTLDFYASPRLKELFGYLRDEEMSYEDCMNRIREDYRPAVHAMAEAAIKMGARFEMEYPVIRFHDGKERWLKGIGNLLHDDQGVESFFTGIVNDITERKAEEQRKNDFIGMVSHELKTPITSLMAIIQVAHAKMKNAEDKFLANAMSKAEIQVKRMTSMINGFLDISRLESGKIVINKTPFEMSELMQEIVDETRLTVPTHRIIVSSCDSTSVYADRVKINSVISNLISNAVKYSAHGTTITMSCKRKPNEVTIGVSDEGIGIHPSDAGKIFERYYRVESSNTLHISGFGIGLYLSAEIVQRHGGKIWVESNPERGSVFYFSLPADNS